MIRIGRVRAASRAIFGEPKDLLGGLVALPLLASGPAMKETPMSIPTRAANDRLFDTTEVLLEVYETVTGKGVRAAVHNFRYQDAKYMRACTYGRH